MKKLLGILVLGLLWCGIAYAECKGNCVNGQGTMEWSDGDQYVGEWKDSKTHGVGTLTWSNGDQYVGEWKDGKEHGVGTLTWSNGTKYAGNWKNGIQDGTGTMRWSNGDQYVGEWKDGKKHGLGKMTSLDGNFFEGTWKNDLRDFSKPFVNPDRKVAYVVWDNSIPISRKKYVYDGDESLKRLIKKNAPTTLKEFKFYKKTENKTFTSLAGLPWDCKNCKQKKEISYDAYIFYARFESGNKIEILVNTKIRKFKTAEKLALRYATALGQLPAFLNTKHGVKSIIIHPGKGRAFAGNKKITIYSDSYVGHLEKTLIHEVAHLTVDHLLVNDLYWKAAVDADGRYITKYARTNEFEDSAETVIFWVALRCVDSISKRTKNRILKSIPNRIKHLDKMNLNTYPLVCK